MPLIIPEVNLKDLHLYKNKNIISNPNCSTLQAVLPLKVIDDIFRLKRIIYSTYQSVSGAGIELMRKTLTQAKEMVKILEEEVEKEGDFKLNCFKNLTKEEEKTAYARVLKK